MPFIAVFGTVAVAGWTRLIVEPAGLYISYFFALLAWFVSIIHPTIVAYKLDELAARSYNRGWVYLLWIVSSGLIGSYVAENRASFFGFEPFRIPAGAMAPTVQQNDLIMADTWYFNHATPKIDELIIFDIPDDPGTKYLKRVVGLPGDTIEIRDDVLIRNGQPIAEEYIQLGESAGRVLRNFGPVEIPIDHYFVLGDNRHRSKDSWFIGPIHEDLLHGRVEYRWFAWDDGVSWSRFPTKLTPDEN